MAVDLLQAWILLSRYHDFVGGKTTPNWLETAIRTIFSSLLKREGNWSRNASRSCLWDRYWGRVSQLLANFFPLLSNSPGSLCESLLGSVSFLFLKWWIRVIIFLWCDMDLLLRQTANGKRQTRDSSWKIFTMRNEQIKNSWKQFIWIELAWIYRFSCSCNKQ